MSTGALNADLAGVLWRPVELVAVTSGPEDRYGVSTDVEGAPVPAQAYFEVTSSEEDAGTDRERREEALLVLWPDAVLKARDVVLVDGERWRVDGPPRKLDGLWAGAPHHVEATLARTREGP
jgi:hypothetical protein